MDICFTNAVNILCGLPVQGYVWRSLAVVWGLVESGSLAVVLNRLGLEFGLAKVVLAMLLIRVMCLTLLPEFKWLGAAMSVMSNGLDWMATAMAWKKIE